MTVEKEGPARKERRKRVRKSPRQLEAESRVIQLFGELPKVEPPDDPEQVRPVNPGPKGYRKRIKMGRRFTEMHDRVMAGEITMNEVVAAMDPEELARGQLRAKDGTFRGAPPKWVPSEFHAACMRELLKRGQALYRTHFIVAIEAFTQIAASPDVSPADRLKAAQYIWERVEGKVPDKVEHSTAQPWEQIIGGIVAEAEDEAISRASHVLNGPTAG